MKFRAFGALSATLAVTLVSHPVAAQTTASNQSDPQGEPGINGDIVVTATKQSTTLQKVPAAVTVVENDRLTMLGVTNLVQITNLSSGLAVAPIRSRANLFVRGVGQSLASPNADSNVALNLNGVYLPGQMSGTAFFDVDRVEVLPGPQGTLYGRNSTGGVVNITSRTPGDKFAVDGFVEAGNHGHVQTMAGLDIPLTDSLYSRTAATYNRHDGYISNGEDDKKSIAVRETVVWKPGSGTKLSLVGTYTHEGGTGNVLLNVPPLECGDRCASFDPKALGYYFRVNIFEASATFEQQLGEAATLTYIGGYSHLSQTSFNALFSGPPHVALFNPETAEVQSHEVRVNAKAGRFEGLVGAYYFREKSKVGTVFSPNPATRLDNPFSNKAHGAAVYGQGTFALTGSFRVTGGLRYSYNFKAIDGVNQAYSNATGNLLFSRPYNGRVKMNRVDWKAGLELDVLSNSLLYAGAASGFTPGGFSTGPQVLGQTPAKPFDPVTLVSYSGGLKNRFAGGDVTLNLEGFYYNYKNYQISARDITTGQNLVYNAAKSTVYGLQVDSRFALIKNGVLSVGATYLHAKADRFSTPSATLDGIDLPFSPRWTVNAFYEQAFDLSDGAQLRANVNFKYTSERWTLYTQTSPTYLQAGNTHTDLNFGYYAFNERWSLTAYVRNLEDHLVKTACIISVPGPAACYFEPPRTFGLALGFRL